MMKYYWANWSSNNGSTYGSSEVFTSKRNCIKWAKEVCKANVFVGNIGHWSVIRGIANINKYGEFKSYDYCRVAHGVVRN